MSLRSILRGTGCAIITPFDQGGKVDYDALEKLINYLLDNKVDYIVSLGTTGETPVLDPGEKRDIVAFTSAKIKGRVPLVVGVGGNNTIELIRELESFPLEEATAVLSASPYYNKPSQEGLFQHYKAIAAASPKPVILYNVPGRTGRNMTASTTIRLANEVKNIAGIKEASGDMVQCMEILRDTPEDFLIVSGDDALALPQIACGMDGVISVAANCFPREFSNMIRLCLDNKFAEAREINNRLMNAYDLLFAENNPAGAKAFLSEMGIVQNIMRLPVVPLSDKLHMDVKKYLKK